MELLIIVWLVCAVLCAIVASSKGRSGFGWLVSGFFFGIFALIAVAGMPVLTAERRPPPTDWMSLFITLAIVFGSVWLIATLVGS